MKKKRRKNRNLSETARPLIAALFFLLLAAALFSGWKLFSIMSDYKQAERRYSELAGAVAADAAAATESASAESAEDSPAENEESGVSLLPAQPALSGSRSPVQVDFDALSALSDDVIGWLFLPETVINYPVVQGRDNDYYLTRFLDGTPNTGGTLFADFLCPSDFSGRNTIIYGHNMKDGSMFAPIDDYADQSFYEEHPIMYLNTPGQNYRIEFFSGFTSDPEGFVYRTAFASDEDYALFLRTLESVSEISCPVSVSAEDRIVTLSTCAYTDLDVRFVLCGKLTEIG